MNAPKMGSGTNAELTEFSRNHCPPYPRSARTECPPPPRHCSMNQSNEITKPSWQGTNFRKRMPWDEGPGTNALQPHFLVALPETSNKELSCFFIFVFSNFSDIVWSLLIEIRHWLNCVAVALHRGVRHNSTIAIGHVLTICKKIDTYLNLFKGMQ